MSFLFTSPTITQSGTDNDATTISGISAIAGVTTIIESGRTRLIIPFKLSVTGTMTNTSAVAFTFTRAGTPANEVTITSTGRWNYKESRIVNGFTDWRIMPPMIFTQTVSNGFNGQTANLIYVNGGIQDFAKVEVIGNGGHYWNGGTVILRDVIYNAEGLGLVNDNQITTQSGNPTLDIDGFEFRGTSLFLQNFISTNVSRLQPKFAIRGFGSGFGLTKVLQDFDGKGTGFDLSIYAAGQNSLIVANNPVKGGGVTCGPWNAPNNNNNEYQVTSDLLLKSINDINASVLFKAYHLDNNTGAPVGAGKTATNYTLRKTYNILSNAGGVATLNVLLAAGLNDNAMVRRSAVQTGDLYAFTCFSYLSEPTVTTAINLAGAGVKSATVVQLRDSSISQLTKATVDAYTTLETLDKVYDRAKAFLFDNFAGETATLFTGNGTILDAGTKNIVIDSAAVLPFAYNSGTNTVTIKTTVLSIGTKFKSIATTGTFTITGNALSNIEVNANVTQAIPTNLTNVTITGTLSYNTGTATDVTFTNSTLATVNNSGVGTVTVKRVNSTLTVGTNVIGYTPTTLNFTLNSGRIRVLNNVGVEQFNQDTDGTFELPANATGTWTYRIAKFGNQLIESTITIDGTTKNIVASYIPDTFVIDTLVNIQTYTKLNTTQKIYDYQSYNLTTATGIVLGNKLNKGFGTLSVTGALTFDSTQVSLFEYAGNVLTTKTTGLDENVTLFATGNFVSDVGIGNLVKIRALNLDSEIVYTADSITFYPTLLDRDANTNPGVTTTGGVYRYKYGTIYSGVTMTDPLHIRYVLGANTSLSILNITTGNFIFSLDNTQLIIQVNDNLRIVNKNVIDSSDRYPVDQTF